MQQNGLRIEGKKTHIVRSTRTFTGDLLVKNGTLVIEQSIICFNPQYDEATAIRIHGKSRVEIVGSTVRSEPYQSYVELLPSPDGSPVLISRRTDWYNHAGIRLHGSSYFLADGGEVAEVQVHDSARAVVRKAYVYPVFFPGPGPFTLKDLQLGESVSFRVTAPTGWSFRVDSCVVTGYQLDLVEGSEVTLENCRGVGISFHSRGTEAEEVVLQHVTSDQPVSQEIRAFGATIRMRHSKVPTLNIYVVGNDTVRVVDTVINEAQADGRATLIIEGGSCYYNLLQARDTSRVVMRNVQVRRWPDSSGLSILALDRSTVQLRGCDVAGLTITAAGRSRIELIACTGLDSAKLVKLGKGEIRVRPYL